MRTSTTSTIFFFFGCFLINAFIKLGLVICRVVQSMTWGDESAYRCSSPSFFLFILALGLSFAISLSLSLNLSHSRSDFFIFWHSLALHRKTPATFQRQIIIAIGFYCYLRYTLISWVANIHTVLLYILVRCHFSILSVCNRSLKLNKTRNYRKMLGIGAMNACFSISNSLNADDENQALCLVFCQYKTKHTEREREYFIVSFISMSFSGVVLNNRNVYYFYSMFDYFIAMSISNLCLLWNCKPLTW